MDDAFSLVASRMPRTQRLTPFDVRALALGVVAALLIAVFAVFIVTQQRAADARRAHILAEQRAVATAEPAPGPTVGTEGGSTVADGAAVASLLDRQARDAAERALAAATTLGGAQGVEGATPAALSAIEHGVLFVDGPSTAPSVVSVYVGPGGWGAAVHGGDDRCYWVARSAAGRDRYGTGTVCTGLAALAADQPSW
jgi:hypothetical protein